MERMRAKANWVELGYVASMKKGNLQRRCKEGWVRSSICRPRRAWDLRCILGLREGEQLEMAV